MTCSIDISATHRKHTASRSTASCTCHGICTASAIVFPRETPRRILFPGSLEPQRRFGDIGTTEEFTTALKVFCVVFKGLS